MHNFKQFIAVPILAFFLSILSAETPVFAGSYGGGTFSYRGAGNYRGMYGGGAHFSDGHWSRVRHHDRTRWGRHHHRHHHRHDVRHPHGYDRW